MLEARGPQPRIQTLSPAGSWPEPAFGEQFSLVRACHLHGILLCARRQFILIKSRAFFATKAIILRPGQSFTRLGAITPETACQSATRCNCLSLTLHAGRTPLMTPTAPRGGRDGNAFSIFWFHENFLLFQVGSK